MDIHETLIKVTTAHVVDTVYQPNTFTCSAVVARKTKVDSPDQYDSDRGNKEIAAGILNGAPFKDMPRNNYFMLSSTAGGDYVVTYKPQSRLQNVYSERVPGPN
jgi:hypothetical protein